MREVEELQAIQASLALCRIFGHCFLFQFWHIWGFLPTLHYGHLRRHSNTYPCPFFGWVNFCGRQKETVQVILNHLSGQGRRQNREQGNGTWFMGRGCHEQKRSAGESFLGQIWFFWEVSQFISCFAFCKALNTPAISLLPPYLPLWR